MFRRWVFILALFVTALPMYAATGRIECAALRSKTLGRPVRYCALLPPSFDQDKTRKYPVLYWLHGLGGDSQTFVDAGGWAMLEQLRDSGQIGEFVVITPDGDTSFYINAKSGRMPYESFFVSEFIPAMEKRYRATATRATRGISGVSMGGYGALHLAFGHPQLFGSVTAHSAALIDKVSPAILTGGAFRFLNIAFGEPVDVAWWERNNPLRMAATANLAGLKIYFDCGTQDDYGFDAGARALDKLLTSRKVPHESHLYPGRHDWQFVAQHLGSSLQVHSKAFSGK